MPCGNPTQAASRPGSSRASRSSSTSTHEEWLDVTGKGLDWYGEYFGYPYPYSKYDQLIVPDFNAGAMENVGAVTFSERYVYRSKVTQDTHRHRAGTILHEMAHMWFGDLVTMRWWNGLWLNESFATFMSTKAVDAATKFSGSWQDFFGGEKEWAYWEDQLVTTHPIEGPVFDTDQAENNFDGITYGKGASVLKQLNYLLGDEDFREGLQRYFQKYALRNTTVNDFIKMLAEASSKDLTKWQKSWLQSAGVNTLRADWTCGDDGKIAKFSLNQSLSELNEAAKELRSHRTQVGLFKLKGGKLQLAKSYVVNYSGADTAVSEITGAACPDFVYPNYQDYDYVKVELDPTSLKTAQGSLAKIDDPFMRQMIWHNLWEMVTDGKVRTQDYAETVLTQAASEKDTQVLSRVLKTLVDPFQDDTSVMKYLGGKQRDEMGLKVEEFGRNHLAHAVPGSDLQLIWFHSFLDALRSDEAKAYASKLLAGKAKISGLPIDKERRWELIQALARTGTPDAAEIIATELKSDDTDMGQKAGDPRPGQHPRGRQQGAVARRNPRAQRILPEASRSDARVPRAGPGRPEPRGGRALLRHVAQALRIGRRGVHAPVRKLDVSGPLRSADRAEDFGDSGDASFVADHCDQASACWNAGGRAMC